MHKRSTFAGIGILAAVLAAPASLFAQMAPAPYQPEPARTGPVKVGPPRGTVIAVGGGAQGPEIYKAFIDAAGGPDALILDVPNNSISTPMKVAPASFGKGFREHGAH